MTGNKKNILKGVALLVVVIAGLLIISPDTPQDNGGENSTKVVATEESKQDLLHLSRNDRKNYNNDTWRTKNKKFEVVEIAEDGTEITKIFSSTKRGDEYTISAWINNYAIDNSNEGFTTNRYTKRNEEPDFNIMTGTYEFQVHAIDRNDGKRKNLYYRINQLTGELYFKDSINGEYKLCGNLKEGKQTHNLVEEVAKTSLIMNGEAPEFMNNKNRMSRAFKQQ